ncbi:MAG: phage integrase N-terminal SAM-like domain-containing protein [Paludibacter sp.]|nr:phage integrase N-terminal SAM-like domain-containing protein [Paludibacter sp.]
MKNRISTFISDLFEEFLNYYPTKNAHDITEEEIISFLRYLVNDRKISTSYQNQSINAIHPVGF